MPKTGILLDLKLGEEILPSLIDSTKHRVWRVRKCALKGISRFDGMRCLPVSEGVLDAVKACKEGNHVQAKLANSVECGS